MSQPNTGTVGLGHDQRNVLVALVQHGSWNAGCGWSWSTPSRTRQIMESLERRGLAERVPGSGENGKAPAWRPTDDGRAFASRRLGGER